MAKKKRTTKKPGNPVTALRKLDLGCGQNPTPGFEGVDLVKMEGVAVVHDLTSFPWPFPDESVEEVVSNHFFEHLPQETRMPFMDELFRVLAPGGKVTLVMPHYMSVRAVQDPTHQWPPLAPESFLYFNKGWREQNKLTHYPVGCDFDFSYNVTISPAFAGRSQEFLANAITSIPGVAMDLQVVLLKRA